MCRITAWSAGSIVYWSRGGIAAGDTIAVIERPYPQWTLDRVQYYLNIELENRKIMAQLLQLEPLAEAIKKVFRRRL